jgi:serine phosphatase RsbU (regulator of sigma subunit)
MASVLNCGHGPMMIFDQQESTVSRFDAQNPPLGIAPLEDMDVAPTKHDLRNSFLCLATDGITEAEVVGREMGRLLRRELGLDGLAGLLSRVKATSAGERVDAVMHLFEAGKLKTHDDATLLIVTAAGLRSS